MSFCLLFCLVLFLVDIVLFDHEKGKRAACMATELSGVFRALRV